MMYEFKCLNSKFIKILFHDSTPYYNAGSRLFSLLMSDLNAQEQRDPCLQTYNYYAY